ncbi:MAG: threonylcarbamoyl-AMP synthase [Ignavibacterium sp.]|nr:threonylcarbamoyl-AMP synthase [Ignavibacterium sp.]
MIHKSKPNIINIDKDFKKAVSYAKELFLSGGIFIYPTDTIYGFGANPFNEDAKMKIAKVKGRDEWKRYIFLIQNVQLLQQYVELNSEKHIDFLISIWPNPISVVLKLNSKTSEILQSETGAFRVPNNRFCLKLLSEIQMPLISTSVNRSGNPPLLEQSLIIEEFGNEVDAIFYSDTKSYFEASTIIDLSRDKLELIREGKFKMDVLQNKLESV